MKIHRSKKRMAALSAVVAAITPVFTSQITLGQTIPAFSGADGAARNLTGGRGGVVYHVTRLDTKQGDNTIGTLQYGINDSNFIAADSTITKRTIVFDVGGTIWIGNTVAGTTGWDSSSSISIGSNVTVAGQTAPGGITVAGGQIKINGDRRAPIPVSPSANVIFRNVAIASSYGARYTNSTSGYHDISTLDAMDINSNGAMVDHVSAVFATDECISANEGANNTTIQYTTMAQGQSYPQLDTQSPSVYKSHAYGNLWGIGSNALTTFSHNLYAHNNGRLPTVQTSTSALNANGDPGLTDFRNNVIYNWYGNAGYGSSGLPGSINFYNNYYKVGPGGDGSSNNATDFSIIPTSGGTSIFSGTASTKVYQNGGNIRYNLNGTTTTLTNSNFGSAAFQGSANAAAATYTGITDTAALAYANVLAYVGANWWSRSAIDARLVSQVANGTGKITALDDPNNGYNPAGVYVTNNTDNEWNKLLALRSTTNGGTGGTGIYARAANFDTDQDGMPDAWETKHGLNPAVADNNGDFDTDGYTNLEEYINELAEWPAVNALTFVSSDNRFAEIGNWHLNSSSAASATDNWQPSKYDTAQINFGTVFVDAAGQHAGTLKIGNGSASAAMYVTNGWIEVATSTQIANLGNLQISGPGTFSTGSLNSTGPISNLGVLNVSNGGTVTNTITGSGLLNVSGGTLTTQSITQASLAINSGATISATTLNLTATAANNGTLNTSLGGSIAGIVGTGTLNVSGGNLASAGGIVQNSLVIGSNRTVSINVSSASGSVSKLKTISLVSNGTGGYLGALQLHDNDLVIDYSGSVTQYATVLNEVKKGLTILGGNGNGIASSEVDAQTLPGTILGVVDNGAVGGSITSLSGYTNFSANSVLVKYTWFGDSNLDGVVDGSDYILLDTGFSSGGTMGGWVFGDYDYNGVVDSSDYILIDTGYVNQNAVLPEPTAIGLLGLAGLFLRRTKFVSRTK